MMLLYYQLATARSTVPPCRLNVIDAGQKVLRVDRILASKRATNRGKDRLVIRVLEDALAAGEAARKRKRSRKPRV